MPSAGVSLSGRVALRAFGIQPILKPLTKLAKSIHQHKIMGKRIVVKVGSNVLTREDGKLDVTRMSAIVDQIVWLRKARL